MRRAKSKVEIAYYEGMRIGISTAIEAFIIKMVLTLQPLICVQVCVKNL